MRKKLILNKGKFYSGIVLLLALFSGQSYKLFSIIDGNNILYKILFFSKYISTLGLTLYVLMKQKKNLNFEIKRVIKIFYPLIFLMLIIEIIAIFKSEVPNVFGIKYFTRSIFIFLDRIFIYILVIDLWILVGKKAIDYLSNIFFIDEILILIRAFFQVGFKGIINSFFGAFAFSEGSSNFFEVHELTFSMGLLIIYYLFFEREKRKKFFRIILLIFCFILGAKRIGICGLIVASLFSLFIYKKGLTRFKLILLGIIGILICYGYLFILYNEKFFLLLNHYGINNMGRDLIYTYFIKRSKFSLFQIGWGIAGVSKVIENMNRAEVLYMVTVRGLHNDILKIYINFGFCGSLIWYIFNFIYIPLKFFRNYGKRISTLYLSLIIYMFVTYLTDNTEAYFICQVTLLIIPLAKYSYNKEINYEKSR